MSEAVAVCHGAFGRVGLYKLDRVMVTHVHRESHLVFYLEGGNGRAIVSERSHDLTRKVGVAVNPMEPHHFEPAENSEPCYCLVLYVSPYWVLNKSKATAQILRFGQTCVPVTKKLERDLAKLARVTYENKSARVVEETLFETFRGSYNATWSGTEHINSASLASRAILKSMDLMEFNYLHEGAIEDLVEEVGISRPHFFSLFRREIGVSPNMYLNTLRVERAVETLTTTDRSVENIGFELGFSSQSSFSRFFLKNVGVSPSIYRRASTNY